MLLQAERTDGVKILLNTDYIVRAEPLETESHTLVKMADGEEISVKASMKDILDAIRKYQTGSYATERSTIGSEKGPGVE